MDYGRSILDPKLLVGNLPLHGNEGRRVQVFSGWYLYHVVEEDGNI